VAVPKERQRLLPTGLSGRLVRRLVGANADPRDPEIRARLGELEGYVSMGISILLSAAKCVMGLLSGSISLLADAVNNLADIGSSLIIALGFRWSRSPRDREHPYGHGRVESVATLVLGIFLVAVAWKVGSAGISRLLEPKPFTASVPVLVLVAVTVGIKIWLAVFARALARATGSVTLQADAWNHTYDIACTSLVVVALLSERMGWHAVDGWAGVGVSLFIGYTGITYSWRAISTLIGEAPTIDQLRRIRELAVSVPGVFSVHEIIVHCYGETLMISLHAEVDARLSAIEAHALAEQVEKTVADECHAKVVVHADPVDHAHPGHAAASAAIADWIRGHAEVVGFHDLRLFGRAESLECAVDLVVRQERLFAEFDGMLLKQVREMGHRLPEIRRFDVGIESEFASDRDYRRVFCRQGTELVPEHQQK
jgi:cation diffusion facilitator family transporter